MRNPRLPTRLRAVFATLLLAACGEVDGGDDMEQVSREERAVEVGARGRVGNPGHATGQIARVMTRNLYLGADLAPAIGAQSLAQLDA